ncbi:IMPACT family protein [Fusobacterium massiliense]|uniref:IMPACT family protein n=1 Tax=Fusobacterium massiliense TaxID=1852365 RepID=UPI00093B965B|nr:YigZ family protein [Fusobacterium massiliense]
MKTIKNETNIEFEEKKSRFIGYVKPVQTKEEAEDFINYIKNKHKDATHNCSAYKITNNGLEFFKVDDDGEPSGTAGKPIGEIITYMGVTNLVVVVTRYFGGIKLGAGGLVRNYAKGAKLSISESEIVDFVEKINLMLELPYEKLSEFEKVLEDYEVDNVEKSFLDKVIVKIKIDKSFYENIKKYLYINILDIF